MGSIPAVLIKCGVCCLFTAISVQVLHKERVCTTCPYTVDSTATQCMTAMLSQAVESISGEEL
jgi:hypothetical protein